MMVQVLTAQPIKGGVLDLPDDETYQIIWNIPDWSNIRESEDLVNAQEAVYETGSPSSWFRTKWQVGLNIIPKSATSLTSPDPQVYWKLLAIIGPQSENLQAKLQTCLLNFHYNSSYYTDDKKEDVKLLEKVQGNFYLFTGLNLVAPHLGRVLTDSLGRLEFILKLTLQPSTFSAPDYERYKMEAFSKTSVERLRRNQAALLNDHPETTDLKFITSDGMEILAHKATLKAHCPVFAAMLNCELSENVTGIIQTTDISGKIMKMILHYFYTGELLPSWSDPATIVEFAYAAGKYQITEVLEMLDGVLGRNSEEEASDLDVQLINLAGKLKLEKAEKRLLERIVAKIKKLETGAELFELFGYEQDEIAELADSLANEKVGESGLLKILEYFNGSMEDEDFLEKGLSLLALLGKEGMKRSEEDLLKRFAEWAEVVEKADQLFNLFGCGKQLRN